MRLKPLSPVSIVAITMTAGLTFMAALAHAQTQLANMGSTEAPTSSAAGVRYDTQYKSNNDGIVAFDDGRVTRIQLPPGTVIPTFFAVRAQGDVLLIPKQSLPYFVVDGIHSKLNLVWANNKTVTITYTGAVSSERLGTAAAFGAAAPQKSHGSAAKPTDTALPSKVTAAQEMKAVPDLPIAEINPSRTETTAVNTTAPSEAKTAIVATPYVVTPRDQTISNALFRWCALAKCQLVWAAEKDLPAMQANYSSDFETALGQLMTDTRHSDYPLHSCMYENNVVRVLHVTQSCGK